MTNHRPKNLTLAHFFLDTVLNNTGVGNGYQSKGHQAQAAKSYSCPLIIDTNFVSLIDLTEDSNETVEIETHDDATMDTMYDMKLFAHDNMKYAEECKNKICRAWIMCLI